MTFRDLIWLSVTSYDFRWQWAKGGWGDAALRGGFVGRGDLEEDILLAGLGTEDERKGQAGRRQSRGGIRGDRDVPGAVGAQREDRVVDRCQIARRDQGFGEAGIWA